VIAYGGPGQPSSITITDAGHTITTDADVAVVSYPKTGPANILLAGGTRLNADGFEVVAKGPAEFKGRLLDFNDAEDTLTIQSDDPFPVGNVMAGQPIIIQHTEDRSTFTIASIEKLEQNRFLVRLDDHPRICKNWLLVKSVGDDGIGIEGGPVLDSKRRTIKVYAGEPVHTMRTLVTDDYSGIEPGQEIALTRLEKGRDTVSVTNFAYVATDEL